MGGSDLRILIVGAGIAGLALARALRLAGLRPEVIEQRPGTTVPGAGPGRPGAGIFLPGNAARTLHELDLDGPVRPLGQVIERQRFLDTAGLPLCSVDLAGFWHQVGACRALPRAELYQVLFTGIGGEVRHGTGITELELGAQSVTVTFDDGGQGEYDLVVGADGRRSTVRALAALGGSPRTTGGLVYHSVVSGGPKLTDWVCALGHRAGFVVMPMGGGWLYCYADESGGANLGDSRNGRLGRAAGTGRTEEGQPPADPLTRLRRLFGDYGDPVPAVLDAMDRAWVTRADEVELGSWSRGRVVLIGDAAHAMSPTLAQGAALALEDAVVLAAELRRARTVTEALAGYESRRRPRTKWVLDRTRDRDRTRDVPPPLRDPLLRARGERIFQEHYRLLLTPL